MPILNREQEEPDKQFKVTLSNPSGVSDVGSNTTATITILDMTSMVPHGFASLAAQPDRSVELNLAGGVSKRFAPYFDLYPIEVSTNLVDWTPLVTLQRTNSFTDPISHVDIEAGGFARRFYRTPSSHLISPFQKPPGQFPVGVISRLVTDPTRRNRYGVATEQLLYGFDLVPGGHASRHEARPARRPAAHAGSGLGCRVGRNPIDGSGASLYVVRASERPLHDEPGALPSCCLLA